MYLTAALALAFAGAGAFSLDRLFGQAGLAALSRPAVAWTAIAVAVALALASAFLHRPAPAGTHV